MTRPVLSLYLTNSPGRNTCRAPPTSPSSDSIDSSSSSSESLSGITAAITSCCNPKQKGCNSHWPQVTAEAVSIFTPLQNPLNGQEEEDYERALKLYRSGEFTPAKELFERLFETHKRVLYSKYTLRCTLLAQDPPSDWNGVYRFESK